MTKFQLTNNLRLPFPLSTWTKNHSLSFNEKNLQSRTHIKTQKKKKSVNKTLRNLWKQITLDSLHSPVSRIGNEMS